MPTRGTAGACLSVLFLVLPLSLSLLLGEPAFAQVSGQQIRQRYDKSTKGASLDDFVKNAMR